MAYYQTCPNCGSNLDPGERCDCQKECGTATEGRTQTGKRRREKLDRQEQKILNAMGAALGK